jgi:hypothetical protein
MSSILIISTIPENKISGKKPVDIFMKAGIIKFRAEGGNTQSMKKSIANEFISAKIL